uniref:Protein AF-9 n=1 Tax=Sphaerodactylus townsendi TaxID=933632 RepID=A0ACB8ERM0_9SAUR
MRVPLLLRAKVRYAGGAPPLCQLSSATGAYAGVGCGSSRSILRLCEEEPKKVRFDYDLFLHLEGHPPVNHLRCEKLTFNNPTEEFRRKLLKAGGIMVMSDGTSAASGQSLHLPNLPSNSLSFSEVKKKSSHGPKDPSKSISTSSSSSSNSFSKPHKLTKEHKEKSSKDLKEHKSAFKEPSREHNRSSKESSKKPKENKPLKDEKIVTKMAFKEPKPMSKEPKSENNILTITSGQQQDKKAPTKRPPGMDSEDLAAKKRKKSGSETLFKSFSSAPPLILTCSTADKRQIKDKSQFKIGKVKMESESLEKKKPTLPPFDDIVDPNDSDMEENMSSKSERGWYVELVIFPNDECKFKGKNSMFKLSFERKILNLSVCDRNGLEPS